MPNLVDELTKRAQALSPEERAWLAERLLAGVEDEPASELEAAWDQEIQRRADEVRSNLAALIPAEDVHARAHKLYERSEVSRDMPEVVLADIDRLGIGDLPHVRRALAVALFRGGDISAASTARAAQVPLSEMLEQLSAMGIPLYGGSPADAVREMDDGAAWLAPAPPSSPADE
jgi:putative addiction module component (TIGR02574 family)